MYLMDLFTVLANVLPNGCIQCNSKLISFRSAFPQMLQMDDMVWQEPSFL